MKILIVLLAISTLLISACGTTQPMAYSPFTAKPLAATSACTGHRVEHCRVERVKTADGGRILTCSCVDATAFRLSHSPWMYKGMAKY